MVVPAAYAFHVHPDHVDENLSHAPRADTAHPNWHQVAGYDWGVDAAPS